MNRSAIHNPSVEALEEHRDVFCREADIIIATLHLACFTFGTIGNITAFRYFINHRKELSTCIYICVSLTDIFISLLTLPVALAYINNREGLLLAIPWFCTLWAGINTIVPHMSVFLVAVLSITRTYSLVRPLQQIKLRHVLVPISGYLSFLILQGTIPMIAGVSTMVYLPEDTYCWSDVEDKVWRNTETVLDCIELGFPIIPILFSCVLSYSRVRRSRQLTIRSRSSCRLKVNASITIIVFTGVYIIFNIPVFVQFMLYLVTLFKYEEYPGPLFSATLMKAYSWNVAFVLCVALNAAVNPLIYFNRIQSFKAHVLNSILGLKLVIYLQKRICNKSSLQNEENSKFLSHSINGTSI